MKDETLKNLEESAKDCHDRAWACDPDSEDYLRYLKQESEYAKLLIEREKNIMDHEIEMKRLELDGEKEKEDFDWKNPKMWIEIGKDLVMLVISFKLQDMMLTKHRRETITFEKEGVWTTQAGRANSNGFKFFPNNKGLL